MRVICCPYPRREGENSRYMYRRGPLCGGQEREREMVVKIYRRENCENDGHGRNERRATLKRYIKIFHAPLIIPILYCRPGKFSQLLRFVTAVSGRAHIQRVIVKSKKKQK